MNEYLGLSLAELAEGRCGEIYMAAVDRGGYMHNGCACTGAESGDFKVMKQRIKSQRSKAID